MPKRGEDDHLDAHELSKWANLAEQIFQGLVAVSTRRKKQRHTITVPTTKQLVTGIRTKRIRNTLREAVERPGLGNVQGQLRPQVRISRVWVCLVVASFCPCWSMWATHVVGDEGDNRAEDLPADVLKNAGFAASE